MKVFSHEVILPQPFTIVTDYNDDNQTEDGIFDSIDLGNGEHGWSVLQWAGSTSYVNVNGTTYSLDEVSE